MFPSRPSPPFISQRTRVEPAPEATRDAKRVREVAAETSDRPDQDAALQKFKDLEAMSSLRTRVQTLEKQASQSETENSELTQELASNKVKST